MTTAPIPDYGYSSSAASYDDEYIARPVLRLCKALGVRTVLDVGCGNGSLAGRLVEAEFDVTGCDPSESGIAVARASVPGATFFVLGVDDDPVRLGPSDFDVVVCTEVIEHLYDRAALLRFARKASSLGDT